MPNLQPDGLRGGVLYHDGQFDDARLLIDLARTAAAHEAVLLNHSRVTSLTRDRGGRVDGVVAEDAETGRELRVRARCVVNATGPFSDAVRQMDTPHAPPIIAPSQGVHLVLEASFLSGSVAVMVPETPDGRVIFLIPWHGRVLVGTTDTPLQKIGRPETEPEAQASEVDFLLETAGRYLCRRPTRADVRSVFVGIRPLVRGGEGTRTAALSRDHTLRVSDAGLLTVAGGKWTTYRQMAEDVVDRAAGLADLPRRPCRTVALPLHVSPAPPDVPSDADVRRFVREEMARTVEDVLARRCRTLLVDVAAARAAAPRVAAVMADALGRDDAWQRDQLASFAEIARHFDVTISRDATRRGVGDA